MLFASEGQVKCFSYSDQMDRLFIQGAHAQWASQRLTKVAIVLRNAVLLLLGACIAEVHFNALPLNSATSHSSGTS